MDTGQIAYDAYCESSGGKSIRGEALPNWDGQAPEIQAHWRAAAKAVEDYLLEEAEGIG